MLIRGGTSSVGLAAAALARWRGATVLSTTRQAGRLTRLKEHGVDHPLLDTGQIAPAVRELYPDGVDAALDLVGTPTLPDTLRAVRVRGTACFSGSLSNQWTVPDFAPNEYLPKGVRLAAIPATPRTYRGRPCRRSWTRSPPASCPSPWTASTTAWSRSGRPTTTWNMTAPPASSSSASGTEDRLLCSGVHAGKPHRRRLGIRQHTRPRATAKARPLVRKSASRRRQACSSQRYG